MAVKNRFPSHQKVSGPSSSASLVTGTTDVNTDGTLCPLWPATTELRHLRYVEIAQKPLTLSSSESHCVAWSAENLTQNRR